MHATSKQSLRISLANSLGVRSMIILALTPPVILGTLGLIAFLGLEIAITRPGAGSWSIRGSLERFPSRL